MIDENIPGDRKDIHAFSAMLVDLNIIDFLLREKRFTIAIVRTISGCPIDDVKLYMHFLRHICIMDNNNNRGNRGELREELIIKKNRVTLTMR
jgi:hypothetical protein